MFVPISEPPILTLLHRSLEFRQCDPEDWQKFKVYARRVHALMQATSFRFMRLYGCFSAFTSKSTAPLCCFRVWRHSSWDLSTSSIECALVLLPFVIFQSPSIAV